MTPEIKEAKTEAAADKQRWEEETLQKVLKKTPERKQKFEGVSLEPVDGLYAEADADGIDVGCGAELRFGGRSGGDYNRGRSGRGRGRVFRRSLLRFRQGIRESEAENKEVQKAS